VSYPAVAASPAARGVGPDGVEPELQCHLYPSPLPVQCHEP